jgi:hypothetical protein
MGGISVTNNDKYSMTEPKAKFVTENIFEKITANFIDFNKIYNDLIIKSTIGTSLFLLLIFIFWSIRRKRLNIRNIISPASTTSTNKSDVVLYLVIPTKRISPAIRQTLIPRQELTAENTKILINEAVYFISCATLDLDNYIQGLDRNKEPINYDFNGDIYIQLFIPGGEDITNNDLKRILSRNLPDCNVFIQEVYLLNTITENICKFHPA